jgi:tetratricopeptide (TPR) repeat protein
MSLLADILSKVAPRKIEGNVPPTLARAVLDSQNRGVRNRRFLFAACCSAFLLAVGFGVVYYAKGLVGPSLLTPSAKANLEALKGSRMENPAKAPDGSRPPQASTPSRLPEATSPLRQPQGETHVQPQMAAKAPAADKAQKEPLPEAGRTSAATLPPSRPAASKPEGTEVPNPAKEMAARLRAEKDDTLYAARNHEAAKEYDEALRLYKKVLDSDRQNHIVLNNVAGILIANGSFKEAAQYAKASLDADRTYVPSMINLAIALVRLDNAEEGKSYLVKAVSLQPSNANGLLNLALLLEKQMNYEESRRYYLQLAGLKNVQGYLGLARVAEKSGRFDDARKLYRDILAGDSADDGAKRFATERLTALEAK